MFVRELHPCSLVRREGTDVVLLSSSSKYLEYWEQGFPEFLQIGNILLRQPDGLSIPRARHIFQDSNTAYIVLDLPKHKADLETYVRENGPLEYEPCVYALLPLTKDLAWLRQVGAAHRQIDPHHIWVDKAADGQRDGLALRPKERIQSMEELGKRYSESRSGSSGLTHSKNARDLQQSMAFLMLLLFQQVHIFLPLGFWDF